MSISRICTVAISTVPPAVSIGSVTGAVGANRVVAACPGSEIARLINRMLIRAKESSRVRFLGIIPPQKQFDHYIVSTLPSKSSLSPSGWYYHVVTAILNIFIDKSQEFFVKNWLMF